MILQVVILLIGFVILIKGADWLVSGASALAKKNNVSDLAIGLTVVAFGTSAPELVVNVLSAIQGHQDIAFGNVIGSNNFNLFMILGIAGLISPLAVQSSTVWKEIPISFIALATLFFLANNFFLSGQPSLSRIDGLILLVMFGLFLLYVYKQLRVDPQINLDSHTKYTTLTTWGLILIGLAGLIVGGRLVVDSAVKMAQEWGISQKVIGLTIIAAGTSLPELATSVVAAIKKNNDIAVGNIIGSNIFNIFLILGVSSVIRPLPYDKAFNGDMYFLAIGTIALFTMMFTGGRKKLDRWEAAILLTVFITYTVLLVTR